jgi:hypothetical protein
MWGKPKTTENGQNLWSYVNLSYYQTVSYLPNRNDKVLFQKCHGSLCNIHKQKAWKT